MKTPKSSRNEYLTPTKVRSSSGFNSKLTNDEPTRITRSKSKSAASKLLKNENSISKLRSVKKLDFTEDNSPCIKMKYNLRGKTPVISQVNNSPIKNTPIKNTPNKKLSTKKTTKKTPKISKNLIDDFFELNIYQKYKKILSATTETDLVFREKETNEINDFFKENLQNNESSSIYISGPPGVGKTATVSSILNKLIDKFEFKSLFLNCMRFQTSNSLFRTILSELTKQNNEENNLLSSIVERLIKIKKMVILVLDEIDILDKLHQEMLNNVFSLPNFKGTKVIIVGISNTLDFTSKKLIKNNSLELKPIKSISFAPYTVDEITGILKNRFAKVNSNEQLIQDSAIQFCARKVSAYCGDARKALEIMRRSIELAEQESISIKSNVLKEQNQQSESSINQTKMVGMQHVNKILSLVYGNIMESEDDDYDFPIQQKIVICLLLLFNKEGNKNPDLDKCFDRFQKICKERDMEFEIKNTKTFLEVCELLETKSYLIVQKSKNLRCIKLMLSISPGEAELLLGKNKLIKYILS